MGVDLYYDTYVGRTAARYIREYKRSEPWCCYVGFPGPHEPWDTPGPWADAYRPADMPAPAAAPESVAARPTGVLDGRLSERPPLTGADIAALRADYAGEVSLIDEAIGEIFQAVRDRGEWGRTMVVFTSDHGEMNGDAGLLYKEVFLDGAVRVPLIIRHPDHTVANTVTGPAELLDVGATVLDFVQPESGGAFRMGRSMAGVVRGGAEALPRTDALSEYKGEVMLATPEWKIGLNVEGETYLLFDRAADESTNLANAPEAADTQRAMENRVLRRLVASSSRQPIFTAAGIRAGGVTGLARRWLGEERFQVAHERLGGRKAKARRGPNSSAPRRAHRRAHRAEQGRVGPAPTPGVVTCLRAARRSRPVTPGIGPPTRPRRRNGPDR